MAREDNSNSEALKTAMENLNVQQQPSSSSRNDAASGNGVEVTCFTEVVDDVTVHLQIIHLGKQIYAWIGCNSGKLGHLYAAASTRPNNTASVTCVLGGNSDNTGTGIARRLVLKTGLNIMLASNIPKNSPLLEANAEKKLVEKLIHLGKDIVTAMTEADSKIYPPPGAVASISDASPVHYIVKIKLFSLLAKTEVEKYESGIDAAGKERRFHGLKLEWGFDEFIQRSTFNDSRYGFLVEDTCVLGAEVFVCRERSRGKGEVLSMTKQPATFKYTWKIENFLKLDEKRQESQIFKFTDKIRWKILLYPKGKDSRMGTHLSLYLALDLETLPAGFRLYVDYTLRIVDQVKDRKLDLSAKAKHWFGASSSESGWTRYVSLDSIYQSNHAYVIQDICIIEAEVIVLGIGSAF
uniref:MATH domain-containing protein n=1 Tax=Salix viminalis TaxID=40686 RepID=A0A6N2LUY1_SALVM